LRVRWWGAHSDSVRGLPADTRDEIVILKSVGWGPRVTCIMVRLFAFVHARFRFQKARQKGGARQDRDPTPIRIGLFDLPRIWSRNAKLPNRPAFVHSKLFPGIEPRGTHTLGGGAVGPGIPGQMAVFRGGTRGRSLPNDPPPT
jgi:hypothetical protein